MKQEEWKWMKDYEGLYEVSNFGNIKSWLPKWDGKPVNMKPVKGSCGYYIVCLHKNKKPKNHYIHSLVLNTFTKKKNKEYQCNHIDGKKNNNRLDNLEWVTRKENCQHSRRLNLQYVKKGNELPHSKLNQEKVKEIRRIYSLRKFSFTEIGQMLDVGRGSVFNVVHGVCWRHIK